MTAPALTAIAPVIKINGQPLPEMALLQLDGLRISAGLRLPARTTLRFADIGYAVAAGELFAIGNVVQIDTPDGTVMFIGEVTGVEMQLDRGQPELTVVADDMSYKLTLGTKVRTFTQVSYAEVIGQIATEYGLQRSVVELTTRHEYLMQADSDFGFLNEIADRTGCDWWMDGHQLTFQPCGQVRGAAVALDAESTLDTFSVRASALHPGTATISGWWPKTKQSVSADGVLPTTGADATLVGPYLKATNLTTTNSTISTADMPGDQQEATDLANRLMQRWTSGTVTAKGSCAANALITPGGSVTISGAGPASGTYHVSEVEHSYSLRGFRTRFTAGDRRLSGLVDMLSGDQSSSFRREGLVVGVVTMVGNSQGSAGDVKVKYTSVGNQVESNWARVITLGAGSQRGMTFMPEVNDEVIVGFEGGDARRPVILGGVYNG
ncbi:MAG: phage baseplate assembly protein V, partial [Nakamurella sp.]